MKNDYIPFTKIMKKVPDFHIDSDTDITNASVNNSFIIGITSIKARVEYIFQNPKLTSYTVATFCKKMKHSVIMKHGTNADKRIS